MIEPESYTQAVGSRIRLPWYADSRARCRSWIGMSIYLAASTLLIPSVPLKAQVVVQEAVATQQPGQGNPAQSPAAKAAGGDAGNKPATAAFTAITIEDKQYQAKDADFKEGQLTIKSDPPQMVALEELQRLVLAHEFKLAIEWGGQKDVDLVQVGAAEGGNGVRDVQLHVTGLAAKALKQVAIVSKPQFRVWRSDIKNSPYWRIAVERVGQAAVAELYFEPPTRDLFETELEVTLTYDDNSNSKATVKATSHTNDKVDPEYPAEKLASKVNRVATIYAQGGDLLNGRVLRGDSETFAIETSWIPLLEVPFAQIRGIFFDGSKPDVKTKFDQKLAKPDEEDFVLVLSKDGGIAEISGRLQGLSDGSLRINFEGQQRSIKLERVQAIVLGHEPAVRGWKGPFQVFRMSSGDLFSATLQSLDEKTLKLKSSWGVDVVVPRESIVELTGRNTRMVNLSELTPLNVEQVSYFDRKMAYVKDKSWNDRPLKLDGKTYSRGLAVHSRCILTYDLAGEYATFRAIVGFEEEAGDRGRVVCRVLADDKELFAKPDFRSIDKPVVVQVSVKGMKQLRLEVDFGEDEDIGDRVIWANARLFRD